MRDWIRLTKTLEHGTTKTTKRGFGGFGVTVSVKAVGFGCPAAGLVAAGSPFPASGQGDRVTTHRRDSGGRYGLRGCACAQPGIAARDPSFGSVGRRSADVHRWALAIRGLHAHSVWPADWEVLLADAISTWCPGGV